MERHEAKMLGLTKYNTGRTCMNGHGADRYTSTGNCVACLIAHINGLAGEAQELRRKFMEETETLNLHVYDVDKEDVKFMVSLLCSKFSDHPQAFFAKSWKTKKYVAKDVSQIEMRVPPAIKRQVYALGRSFADRHRVFKVPCGGGPVALGAVLPELAGPDSQSPA